MGMNDAQTSLEHRVIQKVDFGRMQVGARSSCNCMVWWITRPRIHCLFVPLVNRYWDSLTWDSS